MNTSSSENRKSSTSITDTNMPKSQDEVTTDVVRTGLKTMVSVSESLMQLLSYMEHKCGLTGRLSDFCERLDAALPQMRISFSHSGSCHWLSAEQHAKLYLIVYYLLTGAMAKKAHYALVVLTCTESSVTLALDTDISLYDLIKTDEDQDLQKAIAHIRSIHGRLKGFGLKDGVQRLTVRVEGQV
ncbi:hypothetical protein FNH22_04810 [Fulvivirga sp. M361]|uniref:hypothetical protein n=1 Tax=Fulvivirga sp. M361 TaxID=2594266 RepID=UPI001179B320|nr:hypothetical protein [Fulvivirga sp. M361]TRX61380.1 hypothetical protein FNH22_04810 [Fulvivirga sp. M361]